MPAIAGTDARADARVLSNEEDDRLGLERLIFFSDAVIAIAITLLVLDIRLPDGDLRSTAAMRDALLGLGPKYVAYALSFLAVGALWIGHHQKFRLIRRFDGGLVWINLLFLMVVGFIPFASAVISGHSNAAAYVVYDSTMVVASLLSAATWWYASSGDRLIAPGLSPALRRQSFIAPLRVAVVFALSLVLAFVTPVAARWAWLLLIPAAIDPPRRRARG
jgi:uncharacterized membrane protein